jgi:hypothetical protein
VRQQKLEYVASRERRRSEVWNGERQVTEVQKPTRLRNLQPANKHNGCRKTVTNPQRMYVTVLDDLYVALPQTRGRQRKHRMPVEPCKHKFRDNTKRTIGNMWVHNCIPIRGMYTSHGNRQCVPSRFEFLQALLSARPPPISLLSSPLFPCRPVIFHADFNLACW